MAQGDHDPSSMTQGSAMGNHDLWPMRDGGSGGELIARFRMGWSMGAWLSPTKSERKASPSRLSTAEQNQSSWAA
jgi:hypothetical protein